MPQVFDLSKPRHRSTVSGSQSYYLPTPRPVPAKPEADETLARVAAAESVMDEDVNLSSPREAIARLLQALALGEIALARLIQAELEKVERLSTETNATPSFDEIIALQRSAADVIQVIVRKEELLMEKLSTVLALAEAVSDRPHKHQR